jgi:two-component system NtrC family sensor kinase
MLPWLLLALALTAALVAWAAATRRRTRLRALERQVTQLAAQLDRRLTELFSLQELTYVLSNAVQLQRIAEQAAGFLERFIPGEGVLIALREESDDVLAVAAARGAFADLMGARVPEPEAGIVGVAVARNRLELVDARERPPILLQHHRAARAVVAPLSAHGSTIGAIAIARAAPPFDQEELRLLSSVATHATIALSNARFFELAALGKEQWEATFDAIDDGIAVVDELGRIHRANTALASLIGGPVTDVIGRRITQALVGPSPELASYLEEVRSGTRSRAVTIRDARSDRILQISAYSMPGAVAGWLVTVIEDITERRAMETQLIQTEKMAAVGQLVSGVAHELNNPLTSISGLSEFLLQHATTSERDREHLQVIHEQAERAARIVQNLLTFARKGPTDVGDVDLSDVAQRVISLMAYELRLRKVELAADLASGLAPVRGDRYQLQQVMLNLITNAVQAVSQNAADRPRTIRVRTVAAPGRVLFSVEDSGPGVPEEAVPHIFDPFFTTKEPGEGTGLGLSITFGIVEGHNGRIEVRRSAGGGAVFEVSLPTSGATSPASRLPSAAS